MTNFTDPAATIVILRLSLVSSLVKLNRDNGLIVTVKSDSIRAVITRPKQRRDN